MDAHGISRSWVSSLNSFFYDDPHEANSELLKAIAKHRDRFEFVPVVKPGFPLWKDELEEYIEAHEAKMVRLLPGFHPWEPTSACFQEFLSIIRSKRIVLSIVWRVEDFRSFHGIIRPEFISPNELYAFLNDYSGKVILSGANTPESQKILSECGSNVSIELAYVDSTQCMETLAKGKNSRRLVFGTYSPLLSATSAVLKLQHANITNKQRNNILAENAKRILGSPS